MSRSLLPGLALVWLACASLPVEAPAADATSEELRLRLATFSAEVTVPLGHRLMGVLPVKARRIVDPLYAHGFVLLGAGDPIVFAAVDWCEIRNGAYDRWRDALAESAGTRRDRVLVSSVHQHDAPVADTGAEKLLAAVGLAGELFDADFHEKAVQRVAAAVRRGLERARAITHLGIGQARVEKIASNRRIIHPDGRVDFSRSSSSGGDSICRNAPEGLIDPWLKTISFWDEDAPVLALHCYATHPMSYYGQGGVSADFVGMARERFRRADPVVFQMYVTGCSGDVTAGKYNDGSPEMRPVLADRLYRAMRAAWVSTRRHRLKDVSFRSTQLELDFIGDEQFSEDALKRKLADADAKIADRILAAMSLSTRQRIARGQKIVVPCVDFGPALIVLMPGETFVGYQLMAQGMRSDSFVMAIGYGECWTGYLPTERAFDDNFGHGWRWVSRGSEPRVRAALARVLKARVGPGGPVGLEPETSGSGRRDAAPR